MPNETNLSTIPPTPRPAKLPVHSRAAAAQRLIERPQRPTRGAYYAVPHRRLHSGGWRIRRYLKRKNLRRSNKRYAALDRISTQWTMLPMAMVSLVIIVVLASLLVTLTALVQATQERYQQQATTLIDILPKDSLKLYDAHGTLIYQMVDQDMQTSVPL